MDGPDLINLILYQYQRSGRPLASRGLQLGVLCIMNVYTLLDSLQNVSTCI